MTTIFQKISVFFASGFGSGYLPIAPGSWGSAVMVLAGWWLVELPVSWYVAIIVSIFFIGIWSAKIADAYYAVRTKIEHDNKWIVIDEWVGQLITLLPVYYFGKSLFIFAIGLFLFRAFDTAKFGLARFFDEHHSPWGVMLDDVFAGLHAAVVFTVVLWIAQRTDFLSFIFTI
jgi:phosphatidylglycerophosphatase A